MNRFTKIFSSFFICLFCFYLFSSCNPKESRLKLHSNEEDSSQNKEPQEENEDEFILSTDFNCEKKGRECGRLSECKKFCTEIFSRRSDREVCFKWAKPLVDDFKSLFDTINTEPFHYIPLEVLKCFLSLSEDDSAPFKKLNEEEVKEFLLRLAEDPEMASLLAKKDKGDFSTLDRLFRKLHSHTPNALKKELGLRNETFLTLIYQYHNHPAIIWIDDYIIHRCRRDSRCEEALEYYCEVLKNSSSDELENFFENRHFKNEYRKAIQSKNCGASSCRYGNSSDFVTACEQI